MRTRCAFGLLLLTLAGCGTTRTTDSPRTATEQLLITHSVDQAVSEMDMSVLAGEKVYFDPQYLNKVVDQSYIISTMRQHLLAHGCLLQEDRKQADFIVEARAGAVGTDRTDLMYGVPQFSVPTLVPGVPGASVPEIPVAKRTNQFGVAKLAVFAYHRPSGRPVWQSGVVMKTSTSKDTWVLGAGPFSFGTLHSGTEAGGQVIQIPYEETDEPDGEYLLSVTQQAVWTKPGKELEDKIDPKSNAFHDPDVVQVKGEK